jgi:hypothetical protein
MQHFCPMLEARQRRRFFDSNMIDENQMPRRSFFLVTANILLVARNDKIFQAVRGNAANRHEFQ